MHEDCIFLSHLASVAVDFAKHGECVSKTEYIHLEKMIERWPDFFEKTGKTRQSEGILGILYRNVSCDQPMYDF